MQVPELTIVPSSAVIEVLDQRNRALLPSHKDLAPLYERVGVEPPVADVTVLLHSDYETGSAMPVYQMPYRSREQPIRPKSEVINVNARGLTEQAILAGYAEALMMRHDRPEEMRRRTKVLPRTVAVAMGALGTGYMANSYLGTNWGYVGIGVTAGAIAIAWQRLRRPYEAPPVDLDGLASPIRVVDGLKINY